MHVPVQLLSKRCWNFPGLWLSESSLSSQNALLAPLLTWSSWWMVLGALDARTSNTSVISLVPWLVPLTSERTRQGLLWFSTALTPGKSSAWTSTLERVNCCGLSTTCLTRVATQWQVHHACTCLCYYLSDHQISDITSVSDMILHPWFLMWGRAVQKKDFYQCNATVAFEAQNRFCLSIWTDIADSGPHCLCGFCLWAADLEAQPSSEQARQNLLTRAKPDLQLSHNHTKLEISTLSEYFPYSLWVENKYSFHMFISQCNSGGQ